MRITITRIVVALASVSTGGILLPLPAAAQTGVPTGPAASLIRPSQKAAPRVAPPPALPGATERPGSVAPPTETPADMSPNDALFDAINRGDIAAARDALSRGAQVDAHDVLGLTPIELAVDLGRNDIAFLLLSMRGSEGLGASGPPAALASAGKAAAKPVKSMTKASRAPKVEARRSIPINPPAAPEQPKLFANDGGTPIPSIGFVGFGQRGAP